jgi:hypothetical protein
MRNENYINIQGWMINELGLSGSKLTLYAIIYGFSQDGVNEYRASFKYISKAIGLKKRQAVRVINWLVDNGFILKTVGDCEKTNSYKYNPDLVQKLRHPSVTEDTTPSVMMTLPPSVKMTLPPHDININNIYIYNNNKYTIDSAFFAFYQLYPRKVAKANAKKAFAKIQPSEFQAVMDGLTAQLPELKASEEKFRPHPASWLNARRWEDEAEEKSDEWYLEEMARIGGGRFRTLYGKELDERISRKFYAKWNS